MSRVLSGNFLWVLDAKACGGVDKVVGLARETGYGICAKFHDGDPADDAKFGFQDNFAQFAARCKPLNVPLVAWGYCYGDAYGSLTKEAAATIQSLNAGAQAYVIDAEAEWETGNGAQWASRFMSAVLAKVPDAEIGLSTFWNLRWHGQFPAKAFQQSGCLTAMPQVYYKSANRTALDDRRTMHSISSSDFQAAGFSNIYPTGEFSDNVTDTVDFLELAGTQPHSFWLIDGFQDSPSLRILRLRVTGDDAATDVGRAPGCRVSKSPS